MSDTAKCALCLATKSTGDLVDVQLGYGACRGGCDAVSPPARFVDVFGDESSQRAAVRIDAALERLGHKVDRL